MNRFRSGSISFMITSADLVFLLVLFLCLVRLHGHLLDDSDTMWHLRLGDDILRERAIPQGDTLSITCLGKPWVNQSWGFDVICALVHRWRGWSAVIGVTAIALAWIYWSLARWLEREGFPALVVMAAAMFAARVGMVHYLARPHIVSFGFFIWMSAACRGYFLGKSRQIWLAPLVMMAWANLHGGFVAGLMVMTIAMAGYLVQGPWDRAGRKLGEFGLVWLLCVLTPLINPRGFELYQHIIGFMTTFGIGDLNREFLPVQFQKTDVTMAEWLVIALIALPCLSKLAQTRYDLTQALAWMHFGLSSIRYLPFFAIAAAPGLARMLQGMLPTSEEATPTKPRTKLPWIPLTATLGLLIAIGAGVRLGSLNPERYPTGSIATINALPQNEAIFHEMNWGAVLSWECSPRRLNQIDNRNEIFGRDRILEHLAALEGQQVWQNVLERDHYTTVWLKTDRPLAKILEANPTLWQVLHKDHISIVLKKR